MSAALDMTLDDIIKNNKKSGSGNSRGRGARTSRSGPGPSRRFSNRAANRAAPYSTAKAPEATWQHDMYADQHVAVGGYPAQGGRAPSIETGTKLYISNLDFGVSNDDIKELFSEVGDMKRHGVHYDRSGRSKGTAEVVFSRRSDAVAAVKRYNNVQLDGKPMKIEIVGTNIATPGVAPATNGAIGNFNGVPRSGQGRGGALRRPGGRGQGIRRDRGRGRGRGGGGRGEKVSAEDLDADLEKYHSEAMQTE
ncbi:THO complex subunit 4A [Cajanus cajan]|uniref:RNA and export factor-binding protein 2 n=1 Tax=Cajanus cajan TaxID=3821 RepID=A0A151TMF4_CAJCA|nr:THO complex subunit 4A [Cajanus cajan]KYP68209.1 RNA and export factor-binding protein 2 [Cajanus cajan]